MDNRCSACDHPHTTQDPFYYDWRGERFWIRRCRSCTHQFVYPHVTAEQQAEIYSDSYFQAGGDWVCEVWEGSYEDEEANLRKEAQDILALLGEPSGTLLDIGCAGGVFLDCARAAGFEVQGLEINEKMAQQARERFDLDVVNSRVEDAGDRWSDLDVVTLLDVLEHIPRPLDTIRLISKWSKPGAKLLIRGPVSNSGALKEAIRRVIRLDKQLDGYPLDANMFNRRSLTAMLDAAGYDAAQWWEAPGFANLLAVKR